MMSWRHVCRTRRLTILGVQLLAANIVNLPFSFRAHQTQRSRWHARCLAFNFANYHMNEDSKRLKDGTASSKQLDGE
jgi:hypothetical protein